MLGRESGPNAYRGQICPSLSWGISEIIIQQIVTLSKYGHDALDICHP